MNDTIEIKAINGELTWNLPIAVLLEKTCYNINFENNKIEVFLSRGEIIEGIEFIRAVIGNFELSEINNIYFNQITFELITPETEVREIIMTLFEKGITTKINGNYLTIFYEGKNPTIRSNVELITGRTIDLNNTTNWTFDITDIRQQLKSEYRFYSYDYHYSLTYNYGWLELKNIEILGLKDYNFRAYYHYNGEGIINLETVIGNTIFDYEKTEKYLVNYLGQPINLESEGLDTTYKNKVWRTDELEVRLHSSYIPRSEPEQFRYELEMKKYRA